MSETIPAISGGPRDMTASKCKSFRLVNRLVLTGISANNRQSTAIVILRDWILPDLTGFVKTSKIVKLDWSQTGLVTSRDWSRTGQERVPHPWITNRTYHPLGFRTACWLVKIFGSGNRKSGNRKSNDRLTGDRKTVAVNWNCCRSRCKDKSIFSLIQKLSFVCSVEIINIPNWDWLSEKKSLMSHPTHFLALKISPLDFSISVLF